MRTWLRLLARAWSAKPTAVTIPIVMVPIGICALILGTDISQAFTNISADGGVVVIRIMGAAMLTGGVLVIVSIVRGDAVQEAIGLAFAAFGAAIYGGGVVIGLGEQGLVAGLGYLAIAVGFVGRIRLLVAGGRAQRSRHGS